MYRQPALSCVPLYCLPCPSAVVAIEAEYLAGQLAELPAMQAALEAAEAVAKCEKDHTGLAAHVCC